MPFVPKNTKQKEPSCYKTLYITQALADKVLQIAKENNTSFNNVVISMIEHCLQENEASR